MSESGFPLLLLIILLISTDGQAFHSWNSLFFVDAFSEKKNMAGWS